MVPRPSSLSLLALLVGPLFMTTACRPETAPIAHTADSPDALARSVLEALSAHDRDRLRSLALDEREFRDHVWPELPAARPERNLPAEYVWGDLKQKSEASLAQMLASHGGRRYRLARVRFTGATTRYATYLVHRDAHLVVRDESGAEQELRLFGSVIETADGRVKVFSYVVD